MTKPAGKNDGKRGIVLQEVAAEAVRSRTPSQPGEFDKFIARSFSRNDVVACRAGSPDPPFCQTGRGAATPPYNVHAGTIAELHQHG
jgi:hypothetical protein